MTIFKLLKNGLNGLKAAREKANQLAPDENLKTINKYMDSKEKSHRVKCAFEMEENFLSTIAEHAKEQSSDKNINLIEISDIVEKAYKKLTAMDQFFDQKTEANLIDMKKDFFIRHFEKIKLPVMADEESQKAINQQHNQLFAKRRHKLQELRGATNNSEAFAKVLCAYLARSDYPKKNAFDILPKEIEGFFDHERRNALHLDGVKIMDSILG